MTSVRHVLKDSPRASKSLSRRTLTMGMALLYLAQATCALLAECGVRSCDAD